VGGVAGGMSAAARLRGWTSPPRSWCWSAASACRSPTAGSRTTPAAASSSATPCCCRPRRACGHGSGSMSAPVPRCSAATVRRGRSRCAGPAAPWAPRGYDVLVLSPGARPIVPEIPGVERALVLRDVSDVDRVVAGLRSGARSAVIVGGGFIGVEMAEQLRHRGLDVTLVELADQVLAPLDPETAAPVLAELQAHGVDVRLGEQVTKLLPDTGGPRLRRHRAGRPRPVQVRFGEEEFAAIELAAGRAGLTPTGYVGAVALAAARGTVPPAPSQSREALTEVRRFGGNVNQHHCRRSCGRSRTATRCLHSPAGSGPSSPITRCVARCVGRTSRQRHIDAQP
jgi:hypothetical protein